MSADDIPSLTLKVLQGIQSEVVGLRGDVRQLDTHVQQLDTHVQQLDTRMERVETEIKTLNGEVKAINSRFDHFLTFVGKDVTDLRDRVSKVEAHIGLR